MPPSDQDLYALAQRMMNGFASAYTRSRSMPRESVAEMHARIKAESEAAARKLDPPAPTVWQHLMEDDE